MEKNQQDLLQQIKKYQLNYPQEIATTKKFIDFIQNNQDCFSPQLEKGHITASGFILNQKKDSCLLIFHQKLKKWLQPGGHLENETPQSAVLREVYEETGLKFLSFFQKEIFDLDIHFIPNYKNIKSHLHFDIRYLLYEKNSQKIKKNRESSDICWVKLDKIKEYTTEKSILRMQSKTIKYKNFRNYILKKKIAKNGNL